MKKIRIYILCFIGLVGLETCEKPIVPNDNTIKVSIVFDDILSESDQKLFVDRAAAELYWTSGDEIKLVNATNNLTLTYSGVNERIASFSCGSSIPNQSYIGFHPTTAIVNAYNNITFTAAASYTIDSAAPDAYITPNLLMYTPEKYNHGGSNMAYLKPAMTILDIPLKTDSGVYHIKSIVLTSVGSSNAFIKQGKLPDVINYTGLSLTTISSGNTITYNFTGKGLPFNSTLKTIKLLVWSNPAASNLTSYSLAINATAVVKNITKTSPFLNSKYYKFKNAIALPTDTVVNPVPPAIKVGDSYGGGYVFHIFTSGQPGYVAGETHGLIAAPALTNTYVWDENVTQGTVVQTDSAIGTGASNTTKMITAGCAGAAKACKDYRGGGYADWFLASYFEMNTLWTILNNNNATMSIFKNYNESHLTSSEIVTGGTSQWNPFVALQASVKKSYGTTGQENKVYSYSVIPVRAF